MNKKVLPVSTRKSLISELVSRKKNDSSKSKLSEKEKQSKHNIDVLAPIYNHTLSKTDAIKDLLRENPDLELGIEILVSSIVAPHDMITTNLIVDLTKSLLPPDAARDVRDIILRDIDGYYEVNDLLYDWVYNAYNPGAHINVCIGDNFKDDLFKKYADTESYSKNTYTHTNESEVDKIISNALTVTDDASILNYRKNVCEFAASGKDAESYNSSKTKLETLRRLIMLPENNAIGNIDRPLFFNWPMESVIPVILKNEPSKHLKYILLLDGMGMPLSNTKVDIKKNDDEPILSQMIKNARASSAATVTRKAAVQTAPMLDAKDLITEAIDSKIKMIMDKDNLTGYVNDDDYIMLKKLLFNKAMNNEKVNVLVVPANCVSYLTFEYKINGVGKSVLEDLTVIGGIRAMLRYSTLSALVQNATQLTKVKVKLDDDDKDLEVRIQEAYEFIYNNKEDSVPIGLLKLEDINDWLKKVGVIVEFEHENLPEVNFEIERLDKNKEVPDSELDEKLAKISYMKMQLAPEMLDAAADVDYAESVKTSNVLFRRRMVRKQKTVSAFTTKLIKSILSNDGIIKRDIEVVIKSNLPLIKKRLQKNERVKDFLNAMTDEDIVELMFNDIEDTVKLRIPDIESSEENVNSEAFASFKNTIDDILDAVLSEDIFPEEFIGETNATIDYVKEMLKSSMIRRWLNTNGYFKDTMKLLNTDGDKVTIPLLEEYSNYSDDFASGMKEFLKEIKKVKKKGDKIWDKFLSEEEEEVVEPSTPTESTPEKVDASTSDNLELPEPIEIN